jgi:hypothetical protein
VRLIEYTPLIMSARQRCGKHVFDCQSICRILITLSKGEWQMISERVWRVALTATAVLITIGSQAQITDDDKRVQAFVAEAARRLPPGEALDALRAGPAEEYYRWGAEICSELANGTRDEAIVGNLAEFFGKELATALVGASRKVICPRTR